MARAAKTGASNVSVSEASVVEETKPQIYEHVTIVRHNLLDYSLEVQEYVQRGFSLSLESPPRLVINSGTFSCLLEKKVNEEKESV